MHPEQRRGVSRAGPVGRAGSNVVELDRSVAERSWRDRLRLAAAAVGVDVEETLIHDLAVRFTEVGFRA